MAHALRGRDIACTSVEGLLDAARAGRAAIVIVEGPPGSGKTALLDAAASHASRRGFDVALGRSDAVQHPLPMGALLSALGPRVVTGPGCGCGSGADERETAVGRVAAELARRADVAPLVVVLDDLQWADPATLHALEVLTTELARVPITWLVSRGLGVGAEQVAVRLDAVLDGLARRGASRVALEPLTDEAVREVVTDIAGAPPDLALVSLAAGADGDAALVVELITGLREEGVIRIRGGRAQSTSDRLPRRIRAVLAGRLERMSERAHRLLEVVAVSTASAGSFTLEDVAEVLAEPTARLVAPLEECVRSGLLSPSNDAPTFRHELWRRGVYERIAEPVRMALHRQVGAVLLAGGGSALPAAPHLLEAARGRDRPAVAGLEKAARELLSSAPRSATTVALRALELTAPSDPARFRRAVVSVSALTGAGLFTDAEYLARTALATGPPVASAAELWCLLASALLQRGAPADSLTAAEVVLTTPRVPKRLAWSAETLRLEALLARDGVASARVAAESLIARDEQVADGALAAALMVLSFASWHRGRIADALRTMRDAVRRAEEARARDPLGAGVSLVTQPKLALALLLTTLGEFAEAEALVRCVATCGAAAPANGRFGSVTALRSRLDMARGRLPEAVAEAEESLSTTEPLSAALYAAPARRVLVEAALRRGDLAGAARRLDDDEERSDGGHPALRLPVRIWLRAEVADARTGAECAMDVLDDAFDDLVASPGSLLHEPSAAWLVRTALAVGDVQRAGAVVEVTEKLAATNSGLRAVDAVAEHSLGLFEGDAAALAHAAERHVHPWLGASAFEDAGTVLTDRGDRQGAAVDLERALVGYLHAGADRDADRVRRRLRLLGVRRRGPHRPRTAFGWSSLTWGEHRIAALVADGLTNREVAARMFLSPHTVDFHLRQTYRKLGIRSRVQLGVLLREHGA